MASHPPGWERKEVLQQKCTKPRKYVLKINQPAALNPLLRIKLIYDCNRRPVKARVKLDVRLDIKTHRAQPALVQDYGKIYRHRKRGLRDFHSHLSSSRTAEQIRETKPGLSQLAKPRRAILMLTSGPRAALSPERPQTPEFCDEPEMGGQSQNSG